MRRILLLIENMGPGGAQVLVGSLATGLPSADWRPLVCCWSGSGPLLSRLAADGVEVRSLSLPRASITSPVRFVIHIARIIEVLMRLIVRERVVLIHSHLQDSNFLAAVLSLLTRRPVILTIHNVQLTPLERLPGSLRYALRTWALRLSMRRAYAVVAVGEQVADSIKSLMGSCASRLRVIRNGVIMPAPVAPAEAAAARMRLGLLADTRVILSVGRLVPQKRQADLVAALPSILRTEPKARLLLAGEGPEEQALKEIAAFHGVSEQVLFLGQRSDVDDLLLASDVFVLPSAYEGVPLALLEAMARGLPVVVSNVPGNAEIVRHAVTGMCVPVGAPECIASTVSQLLASPEERRLMGERGRAFVAERHGVQGMVVQTALLYREALGEKA